MDSIWKKVSDGFAKTIHNLVKTGKHFVSESHFTNLFPDLFDGIHLRSVRRNEEQANIWRAVDGCSFVLGGTVAAEQNHVFRILF